MMENNVLNDIRLNIYLSLRKAVIFIFGFIFIYVPISQLMTDKEHRNFGIELQVIMVLSVLIIIFAILSKKIDWNLVVKITVMSYLFLIGILLVYASAYRLNITLFALLMVAFIPLILIHKNVTTFVYIGLMVAATVFVTILGPTQVKTPSGFIDFEIADEGKVTVMVMLLIGIAITMFVRGSIINILKNLTLALDGQAKAMDEINESKANLVSGLNSSDVAFKQLNEYIMALNQETVEIGQAVNEISQGAVTQTEDLDKSMRILATLSEAIDSVSKTIEELSKETLKSEEMNVSTTHAIQSLESTVKSSDALNEEIYITIEKMLAEFREIIDAIQKIDSIAQQTNLLALNASIESARAGEAGRGFAVVADEIRKLAEETSESAQSINDVIQGIDEHINDAQATMDKLKEQTKETGQIVSNTSSNIMTTIAFLNTTTGKLKTTSETANHIYDLKEEAIHSINTIASVAEEYSATTEQVNAAVVNIVNDIDQIAGNSTTIKNELEKLVE